MPLLDHTVAVIDECGDDHTHTVTSRAPLRAAGQAVAVDPTTCDVYVAVGPDYVTGGRQHVE